MNENNANEKGYLCPIGIPRNIQADIWDFIGKYGDSLTADQRQELALMLADMYLGNTRTDDILEMLDTREEAFSVVFFAFCGKQMAQKVEQSKTDPQQPELFPAEDTQQTQTDFFIQQFATKRKILTSQIARNLPIYANAHGAGIGRADITIHERGNPVVKFDFNSDAVSISGREFTRFDKQVHDAVCTLFGNGIDTFTTETVYKALQNLPGDTDIRGVKLEEINSSLKAAVIRRITIDATEQLKKRHPAIDTEKFKWTGYLLPLEEIEHTNKRGNAVTVWKIIKAPAVYDYSDRLNQISTVSIKLLDTRSRVKNTPEVSLMRDYLTGRIEWMKRAKETGRNILYSTIFAECGIDENKLTQTQRNRKREQVKNILEAFKENGYICGFSETKTGRAFTGIAVAI